MLNKRKTNLLNLMKTDKKKITIKKAICEHLQISWKYYKNRLSNLKREFWLGNENIHLLTARKIRRNGRQRPVERDCKEHYNIPKGESGSTNKIMEME